MLDHLRDTNTLPFTSRLLPFTRQTTHRTLRTLSPAQYTNYRHTNTLVYRSYLTTLALVSPHRDYAQYNTPFKSLLYARYSIRNASSTVTRTLSHYLTYSICTRPLPHVVGTCGSTNRQHLTPCLTRLLCSATLRTRIITPSHLKNILSNTSTIIFIPTATTTFQQHNFSRVRTVTHPFYRLSNIPLLSTLIGCKRNSRHRLNHRRHHRHTRNVCRAIRSIRNHHLLLVSSIVAANTAVTTTSTRLGHTNTTTISNLTVTHI